MPNIEQVIEAWFQAHFSHLTPGTPDYFTATRAKADLLARLAPVEMPDSSQPPETTS
jgi:hypothetical protein